MKSERIIKGYLRGLLISMMFIFTAILSFLGICRAYEGIRNVAYGEKTSAIEVIYGAHNDAIGLRILDFEFTY